MNPLSRPALAAAAMLLIGVLQAAPSAAKFDRLFERIDDSRIELVEPAETSRVLDELRSLLPAGDRARARRYRSVICTYGFREDSRAATACARQGLEEAARAGDVEAQARFEYAIGFALELLDPNGALIAYGRGLQLARRAEDPGLIGDGLVYRGGLRSLQGDQARALADLLNAQAIYDRARLSRRSESNLLNIGIAYRRMGFHAQALPYLRESEAYARRTGNRGDRVSALMQIGYAHEEQHQPGPAIAAFEQALALAHPAHRIDHGYARLGLAQARLAAGDAGRALQDLAQARKDLDVDGTANNEPMLDYTEGRAQALDGQHWAAIAAFDRAEPLMREQDNARYLALLWQARAASHEAAGDVRAALADLQAYGKASARLRAEADDQRVTMARLRFDADRRALERVRLNLDHRLREQEIRALERERPWRWLAIVLGTGLAAALTALALSQHREAHRLRLLALSDPLTGLDNRRQILRLARVALRASAADGQPLSVVALDLDHFKQVNDRHGHAVGDAVLVRAGRAFAGALRRGDRLGRSGGEEFLALLPGTGPDDAADVAERLRGAVAALDVDRLAPGLAVRTSAGFATSRRGERLEDLLARADAALYRAKSAGRNRVVAAD